jgi:phage terminase large subunit
MSTVKIELPPKLVKLFTPKRGELMYRGARGGRGSGKSRSFALMALVFGFAERLRFLCVREYQVAIKESFHAELKSAIQENPWLAAHYDVGVDYLRGKNGTEFLFRGLQNSVRSISKIDICIVEEAEDISQRSWDDLDPTIRNEGCETWVVWNPKLRGSPVDKMFIQNCPPEAMIVQMNYNDNPWFPSTLEKKRIHAYNTKSPEEYNHIWLGAYLERSEAQVFRNYRIAEFTPHPKLWSGPYQGIDFGFSVDPTAAIRCWVYEKRLYIEYECGKVGLTLDETANYIRERIPDFSKYAARADSARPETIELLSRTGIPRIEAVKKGKGSVEDGIEHIKSYGEVVVHSRCVETLREFQRYSYKVDRLSGDILADVVDANNHYIDALRYALQPLMSGGIFDYSTVV